MMQCCKRLTMAILLCCALRLQCAAQQFDESKWGKNTAGLELATREDTRQSTAAGTMLTYNIIGKGFPAGGVYDLWFWTIGKNPQKGITGVSFDKRGLLVCSGKPGACKGKGSDDPINIQATAVKGEPKRFAVVSHDGKIAAYAEAVPFPLEAADKKCKLSVIRESPAAELVEARASGFAPFEMLKVTTQVGSQDSTHSPSASSDGTWKAMIGTKTAGQVSGVATVKVSGKGCAVAVNFNWGEGSGKPQ
jgi:hypothetical protein